MNNWLKNTLIFAAGALVGGYFTKKYIERKQELEYEEYEDENSELEHEEYDDNNIEEIKEDFKGKGYIPSKEEYDRLLNELRYKAEQESRELVNQFDDMVIESNKHNRTPDIPYRITEAEYESEELEDYDMDEYTYYQDGYITDSYGMPVSKEDIDNCFGDIVDDIFWDQSIDQIWIRNDRLKMVFSIVRDLDKFEEVAPTRLKRMAGII